MAEYISKEQLAETAEKEYKALQEKLAAGALTPKDRMAIPQQEMPVAEPKARVRLMSEVALGYTKEQAVVEANRCLQCKNAPCMQGCPVSVPIPSFIAEVAKGEFKKAVDIIKTTNLLPAKANRRSLRLDTECVHGWTIADEARAPRRSSRTTTP